MFLPTLRYAALLILAALFWGAPASAATPCSSLTAVTLDGARIEEASDIAPFSARDPLGGPYTVTRPFCRVRGTIAPSIRFEVWLPVRADWNGKLQGVGNGGVAGQIFVFSLAAATSRGYASVSSDLGHEGSTLDDRFAVGRPDLVADWGHRATHAMTVAAKAIVMAYYGQPARHAYFTGCSGGGRQALMEAQRYPDDYDGIVAGDPTAPFTRLTLGGRLWIAKATLLAPGSYIPAAKIPALARATLAACDRLDGVEDGVIGDPRQCHFDPARIACKGADGPDCLTAEQVAAVRAIYAGSRNANGELIFPGLVPGGEDGPCGWSTYVSGAEPGKGGQYLYADNFVRGMVKEDYSFNSLGFDYDRDLPAAIAKLSPVIDAENPDLSAFKARRGKLINYHGWNDPGVSALSSVAYYERVQARLGDPSDFYRLFMVPGMQHCTGGPGTDQFDMLTALENWVERRTAPDAVPASRIQPGLPKRTRPLCRYPEVARWKGSGSVDEAENFHCAMP